MLDPNFPLKGTTDTGKYIDFTRFLECANGGTYEWGTGGEEKARRRAKDRRVEDERAAEDELNPDLPELRFEHTNINVCLFQQFSIFKSWWARVEHTQNCGFTARMVTAFTGRAIVDRSLGRQPQAQVSSVLHKLWVHSAIKWGHMSTPPSCTFRTGSNSQTAVNELYYTIAELEKKQAWRSAIKAAFGKMEYLVPSAALLTHLCATAWANEDSDLYLSDDAMKCGIAHYASRVFLGCAVADSEAARFAGKSLQETADSSGNSNLRRPLSSQEALAKRILTSCVTDPITMTALSNHVAALRGAAKHSERVQALQFLESKSLGRVIQTRQRGQGEGHNQAFHRCALSAEAQDFLKDLQIPLGLWPTSFPETSRDAAAPPPNEPALPPMRGAGKRGRDNKASLAVAQAKAKAKAAPQPKAKAAQGNSNSQSSQDEKPKRSYTEKGNHSAQFPSKVLLWCNSCDKPASAASSGNLPPMCGGGKRAAAAPAAKAAAAEAAPKRRKAAKAAAKGAARPQAEDSQSSTQGRRSKEEFDKLYTVKTPALKVEIPFEGRKAFVAHEKKWASELVPEHTLSIRHQYYDNADGFQVLLWCNSCEVCQRKHGWRGYSWYNSHTQEVKRAYTPLTAHGDKSVMKRWTPLTSTAEQALKKFVQEHANFTAQDLVKIVETHQPDNRPSDAWLQTWGHNHRVHRSDQKSKPSAFKWREADWQQLKRELGTIDLLDDAPDALKIAAEQHDPDCTVIVFCNPALLRTTLSLLSNTAYVKLCGDGTFRLTEGDWILLTVGALSKHYANASGLYAFRTEFNPLAFALTNKEAEGSYKFFFKSLVRCAQQFGQMDLVTACLQYHADLHMGEDLAMQAVFTAADRVADWAHVSGVCARPKAKAAASRDERFMAYRAGMFATMKKALSRPGQRLLPLIERAFHTLRVLPTALLFHTLTHVLLETLQAQEPSEQAAARSFKRFYINPCDADTAKTRYSVRTWEGHPSPLHLADWWCGLQRVQPGSASGTQAQESWHRHKLKSYMGLRTSLATFGKTLGNFTSSRLKNLRASGDPLPDVPREPFPDKAVLWDAESLTREGRTSAHQLHRTAAYDVWRDDAASTTFLAMPRTLCRYNGQKQAWAFTEDADAEAVPPGTAAKLARLLRATETEAVSESLTSLGLGAEPLRDLDKILRLLNRYTLVIVGEETAQYWHLQTPEELPHVYGLCAFCSTFAVHASCEHMHAALLHLGHISLAAPLFPVRQRRTPVFESEPVPVLLPAAARCSAPPRSAKSEGSSTSSCDKELQRFLTSLGMATWMPTVQREQLTVQQLASLSFQDLRAALPDLPSGVLLRLQEAAQSWYQKRSGGNAGAPAAASVSLRVFISASSSGTLREFYAQAAASAHAVPVPPAVGLLSQLYLYFTKILLQLPSGGRRAEDQGGKLMSGITLFLVSSGSSCHSLLLVYRPRHRHRHVWPPSGTRRRTHPSANTARRKSRSADGAAE